MKRFFLPFVLALAGAASAQDRASAEGFVKAFTAHAEAWEFDAMLADCEPTLIGRQDGGLFTYPVLREDWGRAKEQTKNLPRPKFVTPSTLDFSRVEVVGERAFVDFTHKGATERAGQKPYVQTVKAILTWRDGAWKFWRVEAAHA